MKRCGCCEILPCRCCEGVEPLTPQSTTNRPGLSALFYRVGTHSTFFETMQARLSNFYLETSRFDKEGKPETTKTYPLKDLRTRSGDDMSIALLDAAATMLDVLTFYQERITNEGYLRTATERRSVLEMARLVGYTLRPGVSASVYLAYTMDAKSEPVEIPVGARAQSIPAQGELPQSFETSEKLEARKEWNDLKPRAVRPQKITTTNAEFLDTIYFEGTETNLKPNDPLLFVFEQRKSSPVLRRVKLVEPLFADNRTKITLQVSLKEAIPEENIFENTILQIIERYQNNFKAFCLDEQDKLVSRALKFISDLKKEFNNDALDKPARPVFVKDAVELIDDINESGNARVQKWFGNLSDELVETLRVEGFFDLWLSVLGAIGSFDKFINEAQAAVNMLNKTDKSLKDKLLKVVRTLRGFDEFINEALKIVRALPGFDEHRLENEKKLKELIGSAASNSAFNNLVNLTKPLSAPPSKQPANSLRLGRDAKQIFDVRQDTLPQILTAFNKDIRTTAYTALANATVTKSSPVKIYALRVTAQLFGNSAPIRFQINRRGIIERTNEPPIVERIAVDDTKGKDVEEIKTKPFTHEKETIIYLDATYEKLLPDSWIIVDKRAVDTTGFENFDFTSTDAPKDLIITQAAKVFPPVSRSDYDINSKTTRLDLKQRWIKFKGDDDLRHSPDAEFRLIRQTLVYAQSEQLELAAESINDDMCGSRIELGFLYEGLRAGRWVIVSGERTDIANTSGIRASELVMLAGIEQSYDPNLPGDIIHSTLILANGLAYTYKRETVKIYGNVVKATHGETRAEVLGSGDATQPMQAFLLKQPPLTYISAPTPSGIKSTLHVRVNDIEWDETDTLAELKPQDRNFITKTDDEAKTTVIFGNGEQGARPPTGVENITAVYRNGIGKGGNVKSEQISLLLTKPLGVNEVINPLRASGGADKETRDQARRNAPLALMALDRLVSTRDYADFARTFAGIGKAYATRLYDGRRRFVHLTLAGAEDIPIDVNSDLYNNLRRALSKYGDAFQLVQIAMRKFLALVIIARVRIHPGYLWESVEPKIRAATLDAFSFERRELGQNVYLSEVISVIQRVEGVVYVDVDVLDSISETDIRDEALLRAKMDEWNQSDTPNALEKSEAGSDTSNSKESDKCQPKPYISAKLARVEEDTDGSKKILPAQLAFLLPDVPDTLVLKRIDEEKK